MAHIIDPSNCRTFVTSDGTTYSYVAIPAQPGKPTFLLLHGWPGSAFDWRHLVPLLKPTGAGLIVPDLLGYGNTDKPADPRLYTLRRIGNHLEQILAHQLGADTKVIGVGHDWGVGVLSHMRLFHPARFAALVGLAMAYMPPGTIDIEEISEAAFNVLGYDHFGYWFFNGQDNAAELIEQHHDRLQRILYPADADTMIDNIAEEGGLEEALTADVPLPELAPYITRDELDTHAQILLSGGYTGPLNYYKQAIANYAAPDYVGLTEEQLRVDVPVLWLAALRDPICPPEMMWAAAEPYLNDVTRVDLDGNHWLMLELPRDVFTAIAEFCKDKLGAHI